MTSFNIQRSNQLSLTELKQVAEKAKGTGDGFWECGVNDDPPKPYAIMAWNTIPCQEIVIDGVEKKEVADYVAAFDPETTLKLLKKFDQLQEIVDEMHREARAANTIYEGNKGKDGEPIDLAFGEACGFSKGVQQYANQITTLLIEANTDK